jgi:hypothetical protein
MRGWRFLGRSIIGVAAVAATIAIPAHVASAAGTLYVCTSGANFVESGGAITIIGEGSCIDSNTGAFVPLTFEGGGVGASVPLCLPLIPIVEMPPLAVSLTLSPQGGTPETFAQTWATINPLGSPIYAASISGSGTSGLAGGLSISGLFTCGDPLPVQGPFAIVLSA